MTQAKEGTEVHGTRLQMQAFTDCRTGKDIVDWLMSRGEAATR
jgi:hypothetical protein